MWSDRADAHSPAGHTHYTRCSISGQIGQIRDTTLAAVSLVRSVRPHTLHSLQYLWSDRSDHTHYTRCSISGQIGPITHTTLAAVSLVRSVRSETVHLLQYLWSDRSDQRQYTCCSISGQIGQIRDTTLASISGQIRAPILIPASSQEHAF